MKFDGTSRLHHDCGAFMRLEHMDYDGDESEDLWVCLRLLTPESLKLWRE